MTVQALPGGGEAINPHDLRTLARTSRYDNSTDERDTVAAVDRAVFDRVRTYERALVDVANGFREDAAVDLAAAGDVATALRTEVRYALEEGADPRDLADRYETLRRHADTARAALDRVEREAEWQAARAEDPYTSFCALLSKWPGLRRGIAY